MPEASPAGLDQERNGAESDDESRADRDVEQSFLPLHTNLLHAAPARRAPLLRAFARPPFSPIDRLRASIRSTTSASFFPRGASAATANLRFEASSFCSAFRYSLGCCVGSHSSDICSM